MSADVRILGDGALSRSVAGALSRHGIDTSDIAGLAILADWTHVRELQQVVERSDLPVMLIEDAGGGAIAVGPIFAASTPGCLRCYIARRRANGGRECRPATALTSRALAEIVHETRAFLASGRTALQGEQVEVPVSGVLRRHVLVPVPGCSSCWTGRAPTRNLEFDSLVSSRLGLVHEVRSLEDATDSMVGFTAVGCRTDAFAPLRALNHGLAVDETEERARRRAIAESIERYCAALAPPDLPWARPTELGGRYLDPWSFPAVDPPRRQNPCLRWVKARLLESGAEIWVAAGLVYVPYNGGSGDLAVGVQSSVGLAAATSLEDAIHSALAEIIEREVCLRTWRHPAPVERIPVGPLPLPGLHLSRVPNDSGLEVVVAFLEQAAVPFTSTGLAARPTTAEAARHATLEAVQSRVWLTRWLAEHPSGHPPTPRTMVDHAVAHAVCRGLAPSRWDWLYPQQVAGGIDRRVSWDEVVRRAPGACYVDLTTRDIERAGIRVVRVLVPGRVLTDDDALRPRIGGRSTPHPFG